jgi:hypothetical protein
MLPEMGQGTNSPLKGISTRSGRNIKESGIRTSNVKDTVSGIVGTVNFEGSRRVEVKVVVYALWAL